jgi:hypothetical protein
MALDRAISGKTPDRLRVRLDASARHLLAALACAGVVAAFDHPILAR